MRLAGGLPSPAARQPHQSVQLRRGVKFHNGEPSTPRRSVSIERQLTTPSPRQRRRSPGGEGRGRRRAHVKVVSKGPFPVRLAREDAGSGSVVMLPPEVRPGGRGKTSPRTRSGRAVQSRRVGEGRPGHARAKPGLWRGKPRSSASRSARPETATRIAALAERRDGHIEKSARTGGARGREPQAVVAEAAG